MSEKPIQFHQELAENPYVAFDSDGEGVSRVFDVVWDFHALNQNAKTLSFAHIDEKYRQGIQSYLYSLMQWQKKNSSSGSHAAVSSLKSNRNMLNALAKRLGEGDFDLLSNEREWKRCSKKLERYGGKSVCVHLASLINTLNRAGLVKRYVHKREWTRWICPDARIRQAVALPEAIHVSILKTVVQFVETYHPYRHQIANAMEKFYLYHDEMFNSELNKLGVKTLNDRQMTTFLKRMSTRTRKWPERTVIPDFSFDRRGAWLGKLLRMCFICVGLFSAARKEELLSMNKDSYDDTLATVPKVSGFSTKGNKGEKIFTTWNTAPIAKLALELAFDATQAARKHCQQRLNDYFHNGRLTKDRYNARSQELESAFISSDMSYDSEVLLNKKSLMFKIDGAGKCDALNMKEFNIMATDEDVEEFDYLNPDRTGTLEVGGGLPKLSPHDLRRSFVVFMVKNRLGNALTVKYQLKHRNINMSNWYANYSELARTNQLLMDTQLMSDFDEAIEASTVDAWDEIYNVSDTLSGAEGDRIAQNKAERLAQGEEVIMSRSELVALVRSGDKSIVLLPTGGYCTNRNCERLCSLMDIVEVPCEHKVITDKAAKRLSRERDNLIASFRAINEMGDYANELILDARKKKIQSIEPTLVKHSIPFDSFNDDIKEVWS